MYAFIKRLYIFLILFSIVITGFSFDHMVYADDKQESDWPQPPELVGEAICLMDATTGTVLYSKNPHKKMYPASITKIMTAILAIEKCNLSEEVTFSKECVNSLLADDANIGMTEGEKLPVEDCLYGLMLHSANEVATALAEHISGSVDEFAKLMNERAKEAGAYDCNFVNANGLHNENHYVTAYDMAMITRSAISNPVFVRITGAPEYTISKSNYRPAFTVYHRHKMVHPSSEYYYEGILGGKTGYTDQSGTTLVSYAERDGLRLITVVLKSNGFNAYNDTRALFDFGFENFSQLNISANDNRFSADMNYTDYLTPLFNDAVSSSVYIDSASTVVVPKNVTFQDLDSEILINEKSTKSGDAYTIGQIKYSYKGTEVGSADILTSKNKIVLPDVAEDNISDEKPTTDSIDEKAGTSDTTISDSKPVTDKIKSFLSGIFTKSNLTIAGIVIAILVLVTAVYLYFKKKMKELNEARERKRKRDKNNNRLY